MGGGGMSHACVGYPTKAQGPQHSQRTEDRRPPRTPGKYHHLICVAVPWATVFVFTLQVRNTPPPSNLQRRRTGGGKKRRKEQNVQSSWNTQSTFGKSRPRDAMSVAKSTADLGEQGYQKAQRSAAAKAKKTPRKKES